MVKKILILVPARSARGGIANYYQVLKDRFPNEVEYFERGARTWPVRKGLFSELYRAFIDFQRFKKRIGQGDIAIVQSTTSLGINSIIRDGFFLRFAKKKRVKTIAFFRGWDSMIENKVEQTYLKLFRFFFFHVDLMIVLSKQTKSTLVKWGYTKRILLETTLVDSELINSIHQESIEKKFDILIQNPSINLLYLSRIEKKKGINELLEAFKILKISSNQKFSLSICGDGFELESIKKRIELEGIEDIKLFGFLSGEQKQNAFSNAHIFIFPSHSEGMPNAVLEAMGFGLPVITTPVGGLVDFFIDGVNGYYTGIDNFHELAEKIIKLSKSINSMKQMAIGNFELAKERFSSDEVAIRMMEIFNQLILNDKKF